MLQHGGHCSHAVHPPCDPVQSAGSRAVAAPSSSAAAICCLVLQAKLVSNHAPLPAKRGHYFSSHKPRYQHHLRLLLCCCICGCAASNVGPPFVVVILAARECWVSSNLFSCVCNTSQGSLFTTRQPRRPCTVLRCTYV